MRILICGGRQFEDAGFLWQAMDELHATQPITEVIVGGASGADSLGEHWAKDRGIPYRIFLADWATHGRAAGPIRNKAMLDEKPDLVVAFAGGKGTANCVKQARAAGVRVWQPGSSVEPSEILKADRYLIESWRLGYLNLKEAERRALVSGLLKERYSSTPFYRLNEPTRTIGANWPAESAISSREPVTRDILFPGPRTSR